jgi:hypothetical protein
MSTSQRHIWPVFSTFRARLANRKPFSNSKYASAKFPRVNTHSPVAFESKGSYISLFSSGGGEVLPSMGSRIPGVAAVEIPKVAAPSRLLMRQKTWHLRDQQFDAVKNGACATAAHLAYCAIGSDEKEHYEQAKLVPCRVYRTLLDASSNYDFGEILGTSHFQNVEVVRSNSYVAILLPIDHVLLVGIRATIYLTPHTLDLESPRWGRFGRSS